ncbi:MAG: THUMP domain-containing protein [Pleurocapsa sp. MO_226.B13]|nr:THUMP domain-containing protein [Pleurocapsa sp. MO_226.B13]
MFHWNVVVNLHEHGFRRAFNLLQGLGAVYTTEFLNVLVMEVSNIPRFLETLNTWVSDDPSLLKLISRIVPVTTTFSFQSPAEFETKAKEAVLYLLPSLAGKSFHVRMHRRGFKGSLSSHDEERFLDKIILEELGKMSNPGHITFEDPDAILVVETVGQQAGLSCWNRENLQRYPLLRLD